GAAPVAVLTDRYWRQTLHGDAGVIGRVITVRSQAVTIVGVAARGFRGLTLTETPALFLPFHTIGGVGYPTMNHFAEPNFGASPTSGVQIIAKLKPGTAAEARSRLSEALTP